MLSFFLPLVPVNWKGFLLFSKGDLLGEIFGDPIKIFSLIENFQIECKSSG